jgi:hypothetical protein
VSVLRGEFPGLRTSHRSTIGEASRIASRACIYLFATVALASPQTLNIKDFGAKGDGLTDDSAAIEKASLEVAGTGGVLVCPPGVYLFNPARHKIVMGNNMRLTGGCLIRILPESGNYAYVISARTQTTHVENVVIDGISIDQNALAADSKARIRERDLQASQIAILFFDVRNIVIQNTSIISSGSVAIDCNGPDVKNVKIEHNLITFQKRSDQPYFDNSSIYIDGTDFDVSNNVLRSDADQQAVTAIEVHTGSGTVENNIINWYREGVIASSTHGLKVRANQIASAEAGISLWGQTDSNSDSEVSWNMVSLNKRDHLPSSVGGIFLYQSDESKRPVERVTIADNIIAFEPEASRNMAGFEIWGIGLQYNGTVENVNVLRNTIVNAPFRGIKVGAIGGRGVSRVLVADNTIVNAGVREAPDPSGSHAGIALDGQLNDVEIRGNMVICTSSTCQSYGIYGADRGNDFQNVRVGANFVKRSPGREYSLPPSVERPGK